ncbi:MAG: hypothetical protein P4L81_04535 [Candidatus Pacebacteria bacterium]|nr:hypothetical protein [Candidatus Paceibacterota bacterium]
MEYVTQHKLISTLVLLILIAAAWWGFTNTSAPAPVLANPAAEASSSQDTQIVSVLLQLQAVNLSGTILTDPGFLSLQDFTTQIITEPIGRSNPFAPLAATSTATVVQTKVNPNLFAPAKH